MNETPLNPSHYFAIDGHTHGNFLTSGTGQNVWEAMDFLSDYIVSLLGDPSPGTISPDAIIKTNQLYLGEGAEIQAGACIEGPTWIGPGTVVRHGAYVRGNVLVGANCVIGHATEIKHSVLFDGAQASHFAYIGNSIIGCNVLLGAGVRLANRRLDGQVIGLAHVSEQGETTYLSSNRTLLGSIIGDRTAIGCNCVVNPGCLITPDSHIPPLTEIKASRQ